MPRRQALRALLHRAGDGRSRSVFHRLGWFLLLWLGGVAAVSAVAMLIRTVLL
ncbi:hypothetical protein ORIO_17210 [Cereibacter azotoformans]|uniref:hypothetical protein n=1 Tax=Cereibacter azotoformans TaxID=43057 RepID=UPI001EE9B6EE|nr:hypothetical protein [Cereibacter azotoformans]ULB11606.1 hypothetical protein ORIO_17210 [Cereibacter azotoformans]